MILSRVKPATEVPQTQVYGSNKKRIPELEDFLKKRDYVGALTLLEFLKHQGDTNIWIDVWSAFCLFHLGEYSKALNMYNTIQSENGYEQLVGDNIHLNIAVCQFYLGMYTESQQSATKATDSPLKNRLLFHLAHKLNDEDGLMEQHKKLRDVAEDQMCLASIHYMRGHYQEAIDVYKKLLLDKRPDCNTIVWLQMLANNRTHLALNVYVALCYYKLDYYDVSQEVLGVYLNQYPDSTVAINLRACNLFRLYNGKAAENELKAISSEQHTFGQDLVKHNLVVFRTGEGALKVLPPLVDVVSEARLNLAGWRLRAREAGEARDLLLPLQPSAPLHYILHGVVHAALANITGDEEHMKTAQQSFHVVGSSSSECDTIPGRQCMASSYFLYGQYEEALVYLNSIKSFFVNDDTFNFNYAQAKVATGFYREAEESLLTIQDEHIKSCYTYLACLCRCYIMNKRGQQAWELCVKTSGTPESFNLLQLVANDCYRMGQFLVAAKAFQMLDRLEPNPEFWEGMRGACAGVVQGACAGLAGGARGGAGASAQARSVREVVALLRSAEHAQAQSLVRIITRWAGDARLPIS